MVYEHLSTVQGPNVQSSNNGGDYTSRQKNEFANRLYPTKQDFNIREGKESVVRLVSTIRYKNWNQNWKHEGFQFLLFTAECKKLERKEKEFFFYRG